MKRPIKQKGAKAIKLVSRIGEATVHNSTSSPADLKKSGIPGVQPTYREFTDSFSLSYFSKILEV